MPKRLRTAEAGFEKAFRAFLAEKRETSADIEAAVGQILAEVKGRGDAALSDFSRKFDHVELEKAGLRRQHSR